MSLEKIMGKTFSEQEAERILQKFTHNLAPVYGVDVKSLPRHEIKIERCDGNQIPSSFGGVTSIFAGQEIGWKAQRVR